jgi:hypothetical protein
MTLIHDSVGVDIYEGLRYWGQARLTPSLTRDTVILELKAAHHDWKPILQFTVIGGRIEFRTFGTPGGPVSASS